MTGNQFPASALLHPRIRTDNGSGAMLAMVEGVVGFLVRSDSSVAVGANLEVAYLYLCGAGKTLGREFESQSLRRARPRYRILVATTETSESTVKANNRNRVQNICRAVMILEERTPLAKDSVPKWPVFSSDPVCPAQICAKACSRQQIFHPPRYAISERARVACTEKMRLIPAPSGGVLWTPLGLRPFAGSGSIVPCRPVTEAHANTQPQIVTKSGNRVRRCPAGGAICT